MNWKGLIWDSIIFAVPVVRPLINRGSPWEEVHNWALFVAIVAFIVRRFTVAVGPAVTREKLYHRRSYAKTMLAAALDTLRAQIAESRKTNVENVPAIRGNIMMPVRNRFLIGWKKLCMCFWCGDYGSEERSIYWYKKKKGSGTCGEAWRIADIVCFDTENENYRTPEDRLNVKQAEVAKIAGINSVLSVPIPSAEDENRVIGILNFDSDEGIDKTAFDDEDVEKQAYIEAVQFSFFLPEAKIKS